MSKFTTKLEVTPVANSDKLWRLVKNFDYYLGNLSSGMSIKVPKGFITDFASVPRIFWNILPPWGEYGKASVLHDYLYKNNTFSRVICDAIFLEAMGVLKVSTWKKWVLYIGVRLFGWIVFNRYKK